MTNKQQSKFSMFQALISLLNENKQIWHLVVAFATAFGLFSEKTTLLGDIFRERARKIAGIAGSKRNKRKTLTTQALVISGALRAYASAGGHEELRQAIRYKKGELDKLTEKELVATCQNIYKLALDYKEHLPGFNIAEATLTGFGMLTTEYEGMKGITRNAISARKALGETQSELMADIDSLLADQLDAMIISFQETHPQFYKEYMNNRILVDPKTSPTQFAGQVTDAATGLPVRHALVTVLNTPYLVNTRPDGSFKLRVPKPGTYTLQVERAGYAAATLEAELKLGKTTYADIKISLATEPAPAV